MAVFKSQAFAGTGFSPADYVLLTCLAFSIGVRTIFMSVMLGNRAKLISDLSQSLAKIDEKLLDMLPDNRVEDYAKRRSKSMSIVIRYYKGNSIFSKDRGSDKEDL